MNLIKRAIASLQARGFTNTLNVVLAILADKTFDYRYGVNTARHVKLEALVINSESKALGIEYQPTRVGAFNRLMKALDLPRDGMFVDFGSGKGRILILAAIAGFKSVQGVEFSAELCALARDNVFRFQRRTNIKTPISIIENDALLYQIPKNANVFYMFHPFTGSVMKQVVDNIKQSLKEHPRKVWLIYNFPESAEIIEANGEVESARAYEFVGIRFMVYELR